jgi:GMP synthase PP-ATPase subunit
LQQADEVFINSLKNAGFTTRCGGWRHIITGKSVGVMGMSVLFTVALRRNSVDGMTADCAFMISWQR